jgi:hypothetical protein
MVDGGDLPPGFRVESPAIGSTKLWLPVILLSADCKGASPMSRFLGEPSRPGHPGLVLAVNHGDPGSCLFREECVEHLAAVDDFDGTVPRRHELGLGIDADLVIERGGEVGHADAVRIDLATEGV